MAQQFFIDVQFLQTEAYNRGMGRYFYWLFMALLDQEPAASFYCLYSSGLPDDHINDLRQACEKKAGAKVSFVALDLKLHDFNAHNYDASFAANQQTCQDYVQQQLDPKQQAIWLVPCLMQEPAVPAFPAVDGLVRVVIWYDLIPYLLNQHYFADPKAAHTMSYLKRLNLLPYADRIYTISAASKNDLVEFISIPGHKITTINGSINEELVGGEEVLLPAKVKAPFILCPTGTEPSKNVVRTIEGFNDFNAKSGHKYQLVITSGYNPELAAKVKAKNVVFTGHVSADELRALYQASEALLFASTYEGLGLPILEAVHFDKKVVCSNILVFQELGGGDAFYYCDPWQASSIAAALQRALKNGPTLTRTQQATYKTIQTAFSWSTTATKLAASLAQQVARPNPKKKIALVGPHPSSFSTIGKVIAETYPYFVDTAHVDYYYDSGPSDQRHGLLHFHYLSCYDGLYPISELPERASHYDKIVYHMGSSDHHMKTYLITKAHPGTLILHDTHLAGRGLSAQMLSNGYLTSERLDSELQLETGYLGKEERFITSLVSSQPKVIAHSHFSQKVIRDYSLARNKVVKTNLPITTLLFPDSPTPTTPIKLGIVGILAAVKGTDIIEWLFEETAGLKGCELHVFGYGFFTNKEHLRALQKKYPNLKVAFDLSDLDYKRSLMDLDVLVNYRQAYHGETSRATLEAMRERVVPIVRNIGWFSELPDAVAYKLNDIAEVMNIVKRFNNDPASARQELLPMISAGQALLKKDFSFQEYSNVILED